MNVSRRPGDPETERSRRLRTVAFRVTGAAAVLAYAAAVHLATRRQPAQDLAAAVLVAAAALCGLAAFSRPPR